ncbi:MAG TPA: CAP family protein [Panacibacter sp.]|nr:CAP family protein [Panacibacter sp.]
MKKIFLAFTFTFLLLASFAQTVPDSTGSAVSKTDAQQALDMHNKVRKDVGSAPLEWSPQLSAFAQAWADHLAASDCAFEHRPGEGEWASGYGENIFMGSGSFTVNDASESWYSEIKDYVYGALTAENFSGTGHYTQMVWHSTTKVGMGVSVCSNGNYIIVANYDPAGNMLGDKPY